jgi:lysophospholipase L1-like esterase
MNGLLRHSASIWKGLSSSATPDIPTGLTLTVTSDTEISVAYTSDYPVEIWYSTTEGGVYTKHGDSASTPYPMTGLTAGTEYWVKARAKNGSKFSAFGNVVSEYTLLSSANDIPDLAMILDAEGGTFQDIGKTTPAVNNDDPVAVWDDLVITSNSATQATEGLRGTLKTNLFGGLKAIQFNHDRIVTNNLLDASFNKAFSIFYVVDFETPGNNVVICHDGEKFWIGKQIPHRAYRVCTFKFSGLKTPVNTIALGLNSSDKTQVLGFTYDGIKRREFWAGNYKEESETDNLGFSGSMTIGDYTTPDFYYINGNIYKIIIYKRGLSLIESKQVSRYLAALYNLPLCTIRRLIFDGDSISAGAGASDSNNIPNRTKYNLGNNSGDHVVCLAVSGDKISDMLAKFTALGSGYFLNGVPNYFVIFGGTNDIYAGVSVETIYNNLVSICTGVRALGIKVIVLTMLPRGANDKETERQAYNLSIRTNWESFANALVDVGADSVIGDAGDQLNTTYYSDTVHLTNAGMNYVSELIALSIQSLD